MKAHKSIGYRRSGASAGGSHGRSRKALTAILTFFVLGCFWVWKETWHERVASQVLTLEKERQALTVKASYLRRGLLSSSEYARVESVARDRLGMKMPRSAPDTIWCPDSKAPEIQLGAMALCRLRLPGNNP